MLIDQLTMKGLPCRERNHTLFGSVVNAITSSKKTILPFLNRTQSLYVNSTRGQEKPATDESWNTKPSELPKIVANKTVNGKPGANVSNHLISADHPYTNHIPPSSHPNKSPPLLVPQFIEQQPPVQSSHVSSEDEEEVESELEDNQTEIPDSDLDTVISQSTSEQPTDPHIVPNTTLYDKRHGIYVYRDLPQEDSDYEREQSPPTPPPRKLSRKGASFRLACIGKQESDENPLMKKVAEPLRLTQSQAMAVARMTQDGHQRPEINHPNAVRIPPNSPGTMKRMAAANRHSTPNNRLDAYNTEDEGPLYRSLDRGPLTIPHHVLSQYQRAQQRRSSAESLVQKVLKQEGLNRYVDPRILQQEIAEATDMTPDEMDQAARELLRHKRDSKKKREPYMDHLGGYSAHEIKDYNDYSSRDKILRNRSPTSNPSSRNSSVEDAALKSNKSVNVTAL